MRHRCLILEWTSPERERIWIRFRQSDLDRRVTGDALDTVCQCQANIEKLLDDFLKAVFDGKKSTDCGGGEVPVREAANGYHTA